MVKRFDKYLSRYILEFLRLCPACNNYQMCRNWQRCDKCNNNYCSPCSKKKLNNCYNHYETISVICDECLQIIKYHNRTN